MTVTAHIYNNYINILGNKTVNVGTDNLWVAIVNSSYTPSQSSDQYWSTPQADEVSGTGYTAGGIQITPLTWSGYTLTTTLSPSWTGVTFSNGQYFVIYDKSIGSGASTYPLVAYINNGTTFSPSAQTVTLTFSSSQILTMPPS